MCMKRRNCCHRFPPGCEEAIGFLVIAIVILVVITQW